jgi:hypothetical protein
MRTTQITVRSRDCGGNTSRVASIGESLTYLGTEWTVVGLFVGVDPVTGEVDEYMVLEDISDADAPGKGSLDLRGE